MERLRSKRNGKKQYAGRRDIRFVAVHRGGQLDVEAHRLLAAWAADCAEHVLELFTSCYPDDDRPRNAIKVARAWSHGEATVGEAQKAAVAAHAAARAATDPAAQSVARAAGHAVATAHAADHELGAAAYAIKAVRLSIPVDGAKEAAEKEAYWQREQLPEEIRELVISDQSNRMRKFGMLFGS